MPKIGDFDVRFLLNGEVIYAANSAEIEKEYPELKERFFKPGDKVTIHGVSRLIVEKRTSYTKETMDFNVE
ncbi:hypothetical protein [Sutcliffiella sp. FSL R7-0096]|uniref:hypothetical protein n=1 Tax=Sutcliffiella sp. FSL R7-0096 TaxID=2921670 RepID=UPI00315AD640